MPRFLSRAGTHIDDLERQLARVGTDDNEGSGDESPGESVAGETSQLETSQQDHTHIQWYGSTSSPERPRQKTQAKTNRVRSVSIRKRRASSSNSTARKLGTWDGVFQPVMLSIWGIIVFVRMGYFISQIGVVGTVGSFVSGYLITTMTTLSISAISTNGTVKGGGPYYMLSRSLGPEFGGSIGLMFYAGTLLAGVLNDVAFVEPLLNNFGAVNGDVAKIFPEGQWWCILYNSLLLIACTIVCLTGAQMFAKASTALSTIIVASTLSILLSFAIQTPFSNQEVSVHYTGWSIATLKENLWPDLVPLSPGKPPETFGTVVGVLFPACVGIMAGASMSSTLRKPSKSIPKGTLWAVVITFFLYITIAVSLGSTTRRSTLRDNFNVLQEINVVPMLVPIGAITTSVTSTLSGVISSASILQAISRDNLFAFLSPFKRIDKSGSPIWAILFTYSIEQLALFAGDINAVAPYTTTFNLIMFGFINLACLVLRLASSVNFRPTFHYFKAWTALLGAVGCFSVMFFVNAISSLVSIGVVVILFLYVHYTCPPKPWGDITQSLIYHQCRKYMLRLDFRKDHVKFWRPQILLLVHNPRNSLHLIRFCNSLKKGGLYVIGHVIKGDFHEKIIELRRQESAWMRLIDIAQVKAFLNLAVDTEEDRGARTLMFGAGLGGMRPNIVVIGFLDTIHEDGSQTAMQPDSRGDGRLILPTDSIQLNTPISQASYLRIIEDSILMGKAIGIAYGFSKLDATIPLHHHFIPRRHGSTWSVPGQSAGKDGKMYIDLWPIQIGTAAGQGERPTYLTNFDSYVMVLQLGTVLHLVPYWNKSYILRVMCFVENPSDIEEEERRVSKLLRDLRVEAELHVYSLRGSQLAAYEEAISGKMPAESMPISRTKPLPPNVKPKNMTRAQPRSYNIHGQNNSPQLGFSMRVNLPMPMRYEATRFDEELCISSSDSDESDYLADPNDSTATPSEENASPHASAESRWTGATRQVSDGSMALSSLWAAVGDTIETAEPKCTPENATEFNDMPTIVQNKILNELMRRESSQSTALIFTTLQAPDPKTSESPSKTREYLNEIDTLAKQLPPVFLVHATSLTVTTSL